MKQTDEGFKLQTAQEKSWETEKITFLEPRPGERNAIEREIIGELFSEPKLKSYKYRDIRIFRVGIAVDGVKVIKDGARYVPNPSAGITVELLNFLSKEHSYGNKVTGKILEDHFGGLGYG